VNEYLTENDEEEAQIFSEKVRVINDNEFEDFQMNTQVEYIQVTDYNERPTVMLVNIRVVMIK